MPFENCSESVKEHIRQLYLNGMTKDEIYKKLYWFEKELIDFVLDELTKK
jgi:hypothetical protein